MKQQLLALAIGAACSSVVIAPAMASSHREAPAITKYPQVDGTDFYLFNSYEPGRENYVTLIANYIPVQAAYGGPNYFPLDSNALYEIHVDNNGNAEEDITFQFQFNDDISNLNTFPIGGVENSSVLRNAGGIGVNSEPGLSHQESYSLTVVRGDRRTGNAEAVTTATGGNTTFRKPFDYAGTKTFGGAGNYETYARDFITDIDIPGCDTGNDGRVFVGQRNEAFKLALGEIFDLVNLVPIEGDSSPGAGDGGGFSGGVTQDPARNTLAQANVTSLALEIHKDCLLADSAIVGAWTTASLRQATIMNPDATFDQPEVAGGAWTQVSRLSNPLVNELVIGYDLKDKFNSSEPTNDGTSPFAQYVTNPVLPAILESLFGVTAPTNFPRMDLLTAFLTGFDGVNANGSTAEMLRLNTDTTAIPITPRGSQNTFGVVAGDLQGFPNGRRPGDDVVDIALRVVMGALCHPVDLDGDGMATDDLGLCEPADAPAGTLAFTDGAPLAATDLANSFPYLLQPYPGSPIGAPLPTPID